MANLSTARLINGLRVYIESQKGVDVEFNSIYVVFKQLLLQPSHDRTYRNHVVFTQA
jgi:hypothetical protein